MDVKDDFEQYSKDFSCQSNTLNNANINGIIIFKSHNLKNLIENKALKAIKLCLKHFCLMREIIF